MAGLPRSPAREFSLVGSSDGCRDKFATAREGKEDMMYRSPYGRNRRRNRRYAQFGLTGTFYQRVVITLLVGSLIFVFTVIALSDPPIATKPTPTVAPSPVVGQWTTMPYRVSDLVVLEVKVPRPTGSETETIKVSFYIQWGSIAVCSVSEWDRVLQKDGGMLYVCHWNPELTHVPSGTTVAYWYDVFDSVGRSRRGETITAVLP